MTAWATVWATVWVTVWVPLTVPLTVPLCLHHARYATSFVVVDVAVTSRPVVVGVVRHPLLAGEAVAYDQARRRAFVACRKTASLIVVDVRDPTSPFVTGVITSKSSARRG